MLSEAITDKVVDEFLVLCAIWFEFDCKTRWITFEVNLRTNSKSIWFFVWLYDDIVIECVQSWGKKCLLFVFLMVEGVNDVIRVETFTIWHFVKKTLELQTCQMTSYKLQLDDVTEKNTTKIYTSDDTCHPWAINFLFFLVKSLSPWDIYYEKEGGAWG
jgi:hypothetical protein